MECTNFRLNPKSFFGNRPGPVLEPVGGEFQPPFATVYPGGGDYPLVKFRRLHPLRPLIPPVAGLKDNVVFFYFRVKRSWLGAAAVRENSIYTLNLSQPPLVKGRKIFSLS